MMGTIKGHQNVSCKSWICTGIVVAALAALILSGAPGGHGYRLWASETTGEPVAQTGPQATEHASLEDLEGMACTDCHEDLLEATTQHPPAAEQECETCHEISSTDEGASVSFTAPVSELCVMCHDTVAEELDRPHLHGAIEALSCTGCHNPHASDFPRLLRVESNAMCQACHLSAVSPEARKEGSVVILFGSHPVPALDYSQYPTVPVHVQNGRGHPVAKHPVQADSNPLRPEQAFGCISCHEQHGSMRESLLIGPASGSFCRLCHRK